MIRHKTRLDSLMKRLPQDTRVLIVFSHEDKEGLFSDPECTVPLATDAEGITVEFHTVDGRKRPVIIDDI